MTRLTLLLLLASMAQSVSAMDLKGTVIFGPEAMIFDPCTSEELYWIGGSSWSASGWEDVEIALSTLPMCDLHTMPCTAQKVAVEGSGNLSVRGNYGHLAQYPFEIAFAKLRVVDIGNEHACAP